MHLSYRYNIPHVPLHWFYTLNLPQMTHSALGEETGSCAFNFNRARSGSTSSLASGPGALRSDTSLPVQVPVHRYTRLEHSRQSSPPSQTSSKTSLHQETLSHSYPECKCYLTCCFPKAQFTFPPTCSNVVQLKLKVLKKHMETKPC